MAYSSSCHDIAPIPNRTFGCQDLLKQDNCIHSGWLRRQSLRNKLKIFAWPKVYVAIAGGCVYCYASEVSRTPASAFSLYGYDRVFRAGEITEKEATWTFKLVHVNSAYRSYLFSSSSEKEMKQWMAFLKQEMLRANGILNRTEGDGSSWDTAIYNDAGSESISSQDLKELETSIYEDTSNFHLPADYTNKKETDDSDDEMDRVVMSRPDLQERPPLAPPVPRRPDAKKPVKTPSADGAAAVVDELRNMKFNQKSPKVQQKSSQGFETPSVDRGSKPIRRDPEGSSTKKENEQSDASEFWSSIYFNGGREQANEIITKIAEDGVYLVRVNEDKSMVLHVYGKQQARKFLIFSLNNQFSLDKNLEQFDSVENLVYHYYQHPVPKVDVCLSECYLHHPAFRTLHWS
ncbi:uncharacterized protein LOC143275614 [Babylonia areolata]|uniref:uncharacterized protein LOC143275614 n=1 Tax=Babylonia areolata TaxID=304850 RepID=UPI003FD19E4F